MRTSLLLLPIFLLFSACSNPNVPDLRDSNTKDKIISNHSEALHAQNEYKKLQEAREKV